jgi:hypothetical protein
LCKSGELIPATMMENRRIFLLALLGDVGGYVKDFNKRRRR